MKLINKFLFFIFLAIGNIYRAETPLPDIPAPPPGGGGSGPGTPASPIDMYIYVLMVVGLILIAYFVKKNEREIA